MKTDSDGTDPSDMIAALQSLGLSTSLVCWSSEGREQLGKDVADPKVAVVVLVMTKAIDYDVYGNRLWRDDYGHYLYVSAVNLAKQWVAIEDPIYGHYIITFAKLEAAMANHSGCSVFKAWKPSLMDLEIIPVPGVA
jgi:hypothetical protein